MLDQKEAYFLKGIRLLFFYVVRWFITDTDNGHGHNLNWKELWSS
jgi:hypothetical protein